MAVQRILWAESSLDRVRACGHHAVNPSGLVGVKLSTSPAGNRAGFSGLATCGSVWSCPTCNQKIAASRAEEIGNAVKAWESIGGHVVMVTLTMHHRKGQTLTELWDALSYAWSKATSGRGWAEDVRCHGTWINGKFRLPWVRAVESTVGVNGWHLHVHALVFLRGGVDADALGCAMFQRWRDALARKGLRAPVAGSGGLDVKLIEGRAAAMSHYLAKNQYPVNNSPRLATDIDNRASNAARSAGFEVAYGAMKDGRRGNRALFQVLSDVVAHGDADDLAIWHEWETASRGRRQITWSAGFRDWLAFEVEATDDELAAEELAGDVIATIPAAEWKVVRLHKAQILYAAETLPRDWLESHPVSVWLSVVNTG